MAIDLNNRPRRRRAITMQMIGGYVNKGITILQGLVLIPLYLHFIGDRTYGLWLATGGILVWINFADMGLGSAIIQRIASAYAKRQFARVADYFINSLWIYLLTGGLFLIIGFVLSLVLPEWLGASGAESELLKSCFQLAVVSNTLEIYNTHLRNFNNALMRPVWPKIILIGCRAIGLTTIVTLLYKGHGLWSIPVGFFVANGLALFFNIAFSLVLFRQLQAKKWFDSGLLRELFGLIPFVSLSRIGNHLVINIEPTLISLMVRPEAATAFVITRRAADMVSQLLHVLIGSISPSFSHLVGEGHSEKSKRALNRILSVCFGGGLVGFGVYVVANAPFVRLWVGGNQFLGQTITVLIALGLMMCFLENSFSRLLIGTGDIKVPSMMLLAEAFLRLILMFLLLKLAYLNGLPTAMIVSSGVFLVIFYKRLAVRLSFPFIEGLRKFKPVVSLVIVFGVSCVAARYFAFIDTWLGLIVYSSLLLLVLLILSFSMDSNLRTLFAEFSGKILNNRAMLRSK